MDFYLAHELLTCSSFGQGGLFDYFSGEDAFCLVVDQLEYSGETSLAQLFPSGVETGIDVSAYFDYFFFYDDIVEFIGCFHFYEKQWSLFGDVRWVRD